MSRIAKKPIVIPEKVTVVATAESISVKGPLGELKKDISPVITVKVEKEGVTLVPNDNTLETASLWGTYASHIKNMIAGVQKVFEKRLLVEGIGFKFDIKPKDITFSLGFSHTIKLEIPAGVKVVSDKNILVISGMDKESVGAFASKIKSLKKPEPYKGKGIRYENEVIRRKQGKKAA